MGLSDRKKKILQIVVDEYIETAVPVSSKQITEHYMKDVSSATIRSELSALEELGYLTQLHTSSGRVPSAKAYKLYVSDLMTKEKLSVKELNYIKSIFLEKADNLEGVIKSAVKVISELTDYTSLGVSSSSSDDKLQEIKFFRFRPEQALVLIVTDVKLLKDNYIQIPKEMTDAQLNEANIFINKMDLPQYIQIVVILVCIVFSAYFSATETAFSSFNRIRMKNLAEKGNKKAARVIKLADKYDTLLSTILIGNNIVNILATSLATLFFVHLFVEVAKNPNGDTIGSTVSTAVMTVLVLIFGEISPKTIA